MSAKLKRLTGLPAVLRAAGFLALPSYRKMRDGALDGLIPAQQRNGYWYYNEADVPAIARALDLERAEGSRRAA